MQVHNFIYRFIISLNFKFLALVVLEFLCLQKKFLNKQTNNKKKCQKHHNLNLGAEIAFPGPSKFETFILLLQLVFEQELFISSIDILVFGLETRIM